MEGYGGNRERDVGRGEQRGATCAQEDAMMKMGYVAICKER